MSECDSEWLTRALPFAGTQPPAHKLEVRRHVRLAFYVFAYTQWCYTCIHVYIYTITHACILTRIHNKHAFLPTNYNYLVVRPATKNSGYCNPIGREPPGFGNRMLSTNRMAVFVLVPAGRTTKQLDGEDGYSGQIELK